MTAMLRKNQSVQIRCDCGEIMYAEIRDSGLIPVTVCPQCGRRHHVSVCIDTDEPREDRR